MTIEENKNRAIRFAEPVNARNVAECDKMVDEIYGVDYILHVPGTSDDSAARHKDLKQFMHTMIENTPDLHITILDVLGDGDKTATRFTVSATNISTGKPELTEFIVISRFSGGKIVEEWELSVQIPSR